jgi:hypothetical protein
VRLISRLELHDTTDPPYAEIWNIETTGTHISLENMRKAKMSGKLTPKRSLKDWMAGIEQTWPGSE